MGACVREALRPAAAPGVLTRMVAAGRWLLYGSAAGGAGAGEGARVLSVSRDVAGPQGWQGTLRTVS